MRHREPAAGVCAPAIMPTFKLSCPCASQAAPRSRLGLARDGVKVVVDTPQESDRHVPRLFVEARENFGRLG